MRLDPLSSGRHCGSLPGCSTASNVQVRMHREMGMNVIRLWGGNGGAAPGLWDAADEQASVHCEFDRSREVPLTLLPRAQGVLIFQEFWQSGVSAVVLRSAKVFATTPPPDGITRITTGDGPVRNRGP